MSDAKNSDPDAIPPLPYGYQPSGAFLHFRERFQTAEGTEPRLVARLATDPPLDVEKAALTALVLAGVQTAFAQLHVDLRYAPELLTAVALAIATHHPL
jgi:hypothetical protein